MKFQMILDATVFHTHFSLDHNSYVLPLMVFFKLCHHDLTEIVPKRKLGQRNKLNDIKLNGNMNYHFLISKCIRCNCCIFSVSSIGCTFLVYFCTVLSNQLGS